MTNEEHDRGGDATLSESTENVGSPAAAEPVLQRSVGTSLIASGAGTRTQENAVDEQLIRRIEHLPREAGWVLITAGVIGVIAPGIVGAPFLVAGAFVLSPGGPRRLSRWAGRKPRKFTHAALRQICRFIDDLERRYPHRPRAHADAPRAALENRRQFDVQ